MQSGYKNKTIFLLKKEDKIFNARGDKHLAHWTCVFMATRNPHSYHNAYIPLKQLCLVSLWHGFIPSGAKRDANRIAKIKSFGFYDSGKIITYDREHILEMLKKISAKKTSVILTHPFPRNWYFAFLSLFLLFFLLMIFRDR